jgi:lipoprotein-releasing system permease protein
MALGVAALLLALAALSGFQAELKQEILSRTPEIEVEVQGRSAADAVSERAWRTHGVRDVQLTLPGSGWLVTEAGIEAVEMVGFEGELPVHFPAPSDTTTGLYLPQFLATEWSLEVGDIVEVVSSRPALTPFGPQPRVRRLRLHGTFEAGKLEHRSRCAVPLVDAEALLGDEYRVLISTGNLDRAAAVASQMASKLPEVAVVRTWRDLNRALFFALRLEKAVMFLGVLLIIVVAGLALVSDLSLIIANQRREVGMLRAMGMARRSLLWSFFIFGTGLASVGIGLGAVLGLGGAEMLDRYHLLRLPQSVYFLDYVPFLSEPLEFGIVIVVAAGVAVAATLYSVRTVLKLDPVEALRR